MRSVPTGLPPRSPLSPVRSSSKMSLIGSPVCESLGEESIIGGDVVEEGDSVCHGIKMPPLKMIAKKMMSPASLAKRVVADDIWESVDAEAKEVSV